MTAAGRLPALLRRFDSGALLVSLLFIAIFSLAALPPLDSDLWWHLANGRLLVSLGSFPHTDLYSFSAAGRPWVMHEWLADLTMFGLHQLGGLPLLVMVFAGAVTAAAACLFTVLRWSGLPRTPSVLVTLVAMLAGSTAWGVRPQLFNLLMTGVLVCSLVLYGRGRLHAWWLVPFLWLWANLHSGFLVGVVITALFLLGEAIDAWRGTPSMPWPRWRAMAVALVVGLGLSVVNPYGLDTLLFPLGTLTSPLIQNNIQEWASPDFHSMSGRLLEALMFLILLGLATRRVRAPSRDWLWAFALLFLGLASQRHVPLFVLAGAPLIGRCTAALLDWLKDQLPALPMRSGEQAALRSPTLIVQERNTPLLGILNVALLVVVGLGVFTYRALPNLNPAGEAKAIATSFPVATTDALLRLGRPARVFNYYDYGGYLVWRLYPDGGRVFIDGRVEVYGSNVFGDYLSVNYLATSWPDVLGRYQPDAVLLPKAHPLVSLLSRDAGWRQVAEDQVAAVFVPVGSQGTP